MCGAESICLTEGNFILILLLCFLSGGFIGVVITASSVARRYLEENHYDRY